MVAEMERTHVSKEEEGCMGGLMHFFDFNHSLVARKMIASKQTGGKSPYVYVFTCVSVYIWMDPCVCVCVCVKSM